MNTETKEPLVSVIMPCYKMGRFIGDALKSVGKQTYTNWEVIAVDDCGPEDGTKEAVEAFAKQFSNRRVLYHRHEKNGGVSAARNTAIGMAQGEYMAFLDPDDWWVSDYINEQVMILLSEKGATCFCSNILADEKGKAISIRTPTQFFLDNLPASLVYQNYLHPAVEAAILSNPPVVVDVGASSGFYSIGLAYRLPGSQHFAFEMQDGERKSLARTAQNLPSTINLRGLCTPDDLVDIARSEPRGFLVMDCDGAERELLGDQVHSHLKNWTILLEVHDCHAPGGWVKEFCW